jgi:hypothetical protein
MYCKVRADLPTPPEPTMMILWSGRLCFAFDLPIFFFLCLFIKGLRLLLLFKYFKKKKRKKKKERERERENKIK